MASMQPMRTAVRASVPVLRAGVARAAVQPLLLTTAPAAAATQRRRIATSGIGIPPASNKNGDQTDPTGSTAPAGQTQRPLPMPRRRKPSLAGKTAIVTGGSRGIGWAIACRLALEGVSCTLVGRDEAALERAVKSLVPPPPLAAAASPAPLVSVSSSVLSSSAASPSPGDSSSAAAAAAAAAATPHHSLMVGDVRDPSLWGALFAHTPDVHLLVNAAGVSQSTLLARMTPLEIRDVLDVNLYGTIAGCRSAMRAWLKKRSKDRCIINIASLLAVRGGYGATVYAASKAGVVGLTRALAEEGSGRRIRANVILPGYIQTDMIANLPERQLAEMKGRIPLGRFGAPDEVADAAMFLAKNDYANNCVLNLDGGLSAAA